MTTSEGITAPTMIILGDSDSVTLEHAVQFFRLRGGVMGDLEGYARIPSAPSSPLRRTSPTGRARR